MKESADRARNHAAACIYCGVHTADRLAAAIDLREHATGLHSNRVACHTLVLAKRVLTLAVIPPIYALVKQWRLKRGLEGAPREALPLVEQPAG